MLRPRRIGDLGRVDPPSGMLVNVSYTCLFPSHKYKWKYWERVLGISHDNCPKLEISLWETNAWLNSFEFLSQLLLVTTMRHHDCFKLGRRKTILHTYHLTCLPFQIPTHTLKLMWADLYHLSFLINFVFLSFVFLDVFYYDDLKSRVLLKKMRAFSSWLVNIDLSLAI